MLRVCAILLLLALLIPSASMAQGRLFANGDSGLAVDVSNSAWKSGKQTIRALNFGALYTYRGIVDLGVRTGAVGEQNYGKKGWTILGRGVLLDPGRPRGWGLEIQGSYYAYTRGTDLPYIPILPFTEYYATSAKEQIVLAGLRGYHRWAAKEKSRMILGFRAYYRFKKEQILDATGDILLGRDHGGWGLGVDFTGVEFGWLLLMAKLDLFQISFLHTDTIESQFVTTWGLGFLFGMKHDQEAAHE